MFCLPFPNRASDSGDLYINFDRNQLTFPVALLDFQVEARFNHSFANLAYASHTASRIAYHVCIMLFEHCTWLIVFLLLVCLVWVEPGDEFAKEEPIEFAYEDQVNFHNFASKEEERVHEEDKQTKLNGSSQTRRYRNQPEEANTRKKHTT